MATREKKPGQRHLYRIKLDEEQADSSSDKSKQDSEPWSDMNSIKCLTCAEAQTIWQDTEDVAQNTTMSTFRPPETTGRPLDTTASSYAHLNVGHHRNGVFYMNSTAPNNCLYNHVLFSHNNRYYVQVSA